MLVVLKAKIKTLMAEARIIREDEKRWLETGRWQRREDKEEGANTMRESAVRAYANSTKLHHERVHYVRKEARSHLLAYAFLRGMGYDTVENNGCYDPPQWRRIVQIVCDYQVEEPKRTRFNIQMRILSWVRTSSLRIQYYPTWPQDRPISATLLN